MAESHSEKTAISVCPLEIIVCKRLDDRSRMKGDFHVRFCESLRGKFPWATRFVITGANPEMLTEQIRPVVESFLGAKGLQLSEEKTHLCHIEEGFDFLGFNVRKYKQKLLITPSRAKVASFMKRIRDYIKSNIAIQADRFLRGLNSRLRGFANFYRHVVSKKTFSEIDQRVYQRLRNWMH